MSTSVRIFRSLEPPRQTFQVCSGEVRPHFASVEQAERFALSEQPAQADSVVVLQPHKGASMFLHDSLSHRLADWLKMPAFDVGSLFGLETAFQPVFRAQPCGIWYSRMYGDLVPVVDLRDVKKGIVVLRDPRDAAVSLYYSDAYSHGPLPNLETAEQREERRQYWQREGIESHLAQYGISRCGSEFLLLRQAAMRGGFLVVKYEEMVTDPQAFLNRVLAYLKLDPPAALFEDWTPALFSVAKADVWAHKRQVQPGNWKSVFTERLQAQMAEFCGAAMLAEGYT